jgi:hypothetical protein
MLFWGNKPRMDGRAVERYQRTSELSVVYEGATRGMPVHPPDLSTRGMFINTPEYFPAGTLLKLHFRLVYSGYELNVQAKVRHYTPGVGVEVEFVELSPDELRAIEEEIIMADPGYALAVKQGRKTKLLHSGGCAPRSAFSD